MTLIKGEKTSGGKNPRKVLREVINRNDASNVQKNQSNWKKKKLIKNAFIKKKNFFIFSLNIFFAKIRIAQLFSPPSLNRRLKFFSEIVHC